MSPRLSFITDLVIFQVAWFGCVLATRSPFPHLLPILVLLLVLVRVLLSRGLAQALPFTLTCLILGVVGDATLVNLGLLSFEPYPSLFGAPLWMVALWLNFGLMLRPLFTWFLDHCWRAIIGFSAGGVVATTQSYVRDHVRLYANSSDNNFTALSMGSMVVWSYIAASISTFVLVES